MSERIENFRKRRARLQPDADSALNLELDFEGSRESLEGRSLDGELGTAEYGDTGFDMEIGGPAATRGTESPSDEPASLEAPGDETMHFDAAPAGAEEMSLGGPLADRSSHGDSGGTRPIRRGLTKRRKKREFSLRRWAAASWRA